MAVAAQIREERECGLHDSVGVKPKGHLAFKEEKSLPKSKWLASCNHCRWVLRIRPVPYPGEGDKVESEAGDPG